MHHFKIVSIFHQNAALVEIIEFVLYELEESGLFNVGKGSSLSIVQEFLVACLFHPDRTGKLRMTAASCLAMRVSTLQSFLFRTTFIPLAAVPTFCASTCLYGLLLLIERQTPYDHGILKPLVLSGEAGSQYFKQRLQLEEEPEVQRWMLFYEQIPTNRWEQWKQYEFLLSITQQLQIDLCSKQQRAV